ncbi:hypothetical protein P280DRAFT_228401 [Massarina eburnea CBS 473.64]|uniref:Uncharacterized protein n=1 Tax=Massarina eburnea CBS 473.64 TaxID=1395130 RepID=A0A6A6SBY0_9PLEO|nr:hypothetical protein P280DRAFT_228401 [Massarina eburnea CBS 473.64]
MLHPCRYRIAFNTRPFPFGAQLPSFTTTHSRRSFLLHIIILLSSPLPHSCEKTRACHWPHIHVISIEPSGALAGHGITLRSTTGHACTPPSLSRLSLSRSTCLFVTRSTTFARG